MLNKLKSQFNARYGQRLADLNKNVYIASKNDNGSFEMPVIVVGQNGGTAFIGKKEATTLNPPAMVNLSLKNMKPYNIIYRLALDLNECEIASNKPEYFNYYFDAIVDKALANYRVTVGDENKVRFGSKYISAELLDLEGSYIELRFTGEWASNEEDLT